LDSSKLGDIETKVGGTITTNRNSTVLSIKPENLREVCKLVASELPDFYHLTTITGVDEGVDITLYYHFWHSKDFLSLKTTVPKDKPTIASVSDILPSSLLYEAELQDMLGIVFEGNPMKGRKLLLPDSYPAEAPPPLRKEADPEKIRKMMELE